MQRWLSALLVLAFCSSAAAQAACPCPTSVPTCVCTAEQERALIDARLAQLERQRAALPLAGPITLTAVGYGGAALIAAVETLVWLGHVFQAIRDDSGFSASDHPVYRDMGFVAIGFLGVGAAGTAWLVQRNRERRVYSPEIQALKQRRLQLAPMVGAQSLGLSARGTF